MTVIDCIVLEGCPTMAPKTNLHLVDRETRDLNAAKTFVPGSTAREQSLSPPEARDSSWHKQLKLEGCFAQVCSSFFYACRLY